MMIALILAAAVAGGFVLGLAYFYLLRRSAEALAAGYTGGLAFAGMMALRLGSIVILLGLLVAMGAGGLVIGGGLLGFMLARFLSVARARRETAATPPLTAEKGGSSAH